MVLKTQRDGREGTGTVRKAAPPAQLGWLLDKQRLQGFPQNLPQVPTAEELRCAGAGELLRKLSRGCREPRAEPAPRPLAPASRRDCSGTRRSGLPPRSPRWSPPLSSTLPWFWLFISATHRSFGKCFFLTHFNALVNEEPPGKALQACLKTQLCSFLSSTT